jgi:hypothetical protein
LVGNDALEGRRAETYAWLLVLPVMAFVYAAVTVHTLDNISTSPWRWLPLILGASAPVLWIVARIVPGRLSVTLLKAHAAGPVAIWLAAMPTRGAVDQL